MSDTPMGRATSGEASRWAVEASVRTTHRVDEPVIAAVRASIASCHGVARSTGAPGVFLRIRLEAETPAAAYSTALALLARTVLPVLEGSTLMDLRVTADETLPGHPVAPTPSAVLGTAP